MLYAKVVVGLPVEGPFDYIIPAYLSKRLKIGMRVWVPFRGRKILGYVVKIVKKTQIKNLKSIFQIIDDLPILDRKMLVLTKRLSDYYGCSWGEAIETALPQGIRKGKVLNADYRRLYTDGKRLQSSTLLIHDLYGIERWYKYIQEIKIALNDNRSVLILLPDKNSMLRARNMLSTGLDSSIGILYRKDPKELDEWLKIKEGKIRVVVGTRSSIFAPLDNLGLIIIDEEESPVYKQDRVPHYHPREIAFIRIKLEKARLILGSNSPTLESFYLAKNRKIEYELIPHRGIYPEIKIINMRGFLKKGIIFSKYLEDSIASVLSSKGKILLFINRRGFATFASCRHCDIVLRCPRCNIHLVYHFKDNILSCHYCNFKMPAPKICPYCNSDYIRYSGTGTEKIENELSRIFAQARIKNLDKQKGFKLDEADIFVATQAIIKQIGIKFDLIGILGIDNSLNRIDFRSSEKTYVLLVDLLRLTDKKIVIQTKLPNHHCFRALISKDAEVFYKEELKYRKQLLLPPYQHLGMVKIRGKNEEKVKAVSTALFEELNKSNKNKSIKIISVNPGQPSKLRGNFYWQILIKANKAEKITKFLKSHLKDFSYSGLIATIDIDPL